MFKFLREKSRSWSKYKTQLRSENLFKYLVVEIIETVFVALPLALIIRKYIIMTSVVPTPSMVPTLNIGDRLFVNKFVYHFTHPKRGDIVVFRSEDDTKDLVKRCIGLPGETISIKSGNVYINDRIVILPGINIQRDRYNMSETIIPNNQYFMMGDNRGNSLDSRFFGMVVEDQLRGKAWFTFWPLDRMRLLRHQ